MLASNPRRGFVHFVNLGQDSLLSGHRSLLESFKMTEHLFLCLTVFGCVKYCGTELGSDGRWPTEPMLWWEHCQTEDYPSHPQKPTLKVGKIGGNLFFTCSSLFCPLAGRPCEAASVYLHSYLQPERHLFPHAGHLLSFLKVDGRPLLSRAANLPLDPSGAGPFHPCTGNLVLLLTSVSSLHAVSPTLGQLPHRQTVVSILRPYPVTARDKTDSPT